MRASNTCRLDVTGDGLIALFAEIRAALLRYLMARGAASDEAEDILQDVYIKLLADRIADVEQPRAYLYRMTNNQFLAHRRAAGRRVRREEDWVSAQGGGGEADLKPSVETELIARQQLAILQRVLDDLPERTRIIFRRFRIDGEPQREIAGQLGISVSAIEKHLAKAYQAITDAKLRLGEDRATPRRLSGGMNRHAP
jgi:RNA polymerase sigma factor (sigma-70 family)